MSVLKIVFDNDRHYLVAVRVPSRFDRLYRSRNGRMDGTAKPLLAVAYDLSESDFISDRNKRFTDNAYMLLQRNYQFIGRGKSFYGAGKRSVFIVIGVDPALKSLGQFFHLTRRYKCLFLYIINENRLFFKSFCRFFLFSN